MIMFRYRAKGSLILIQEVKKMGKIYGYCRISTKSQSIERQIRNITREYPEAHIVQEAYTGTKINRPEWLKLYKSLKAGDLVIFDSVSRMSRNAEDGFKLYEELFTKGVSLVFLKEHYIDTDTYKRVFDNKLQLTGKTEDIIIKALNEYMLELARNQIRLAFSQSEKEVEDLHQRTREGMETARLNGKQIGRATGSKIITKKSIEKKEEIAKHCKEFGGSLSDEECIKLTGLARNTFYKYKKELREAI